MTKFEATRRYNDQLQIIAKARKAGLEVEEVAKLVRATRKILKRRLERAA